VFEKEREGEREGFGTSLVWKEERFRGERNMWWVPHLYSFSSKVRTIRE